MKTTINGLIDFFIVICSAYSCSIETKQSVRRTILLDKEWKFHQGDIIRNTDSTDWRIVNIPHDWSIEDIPGTNSPFDSLAKYGKGSGFTVGGTSWYVKELSCDEIKQGKKIYILFEGVYLEADVWVNNKHVGYHPYGYTSFYCNISDDLNFDGTSNQIKVKVKNDKPIRWYSGSGIYRPVRLVICNPIHIKQWGTFIHSRIIDNKSALLTISSEIVNKLNENKTVDLLFEVLEENNIVTSIKKKNVGLISNSTTNLVNTIKLDNPKFWSAQSPNLYSLRTTVRVDEKTIDNTVESFGIRTIVADSIKGLLVNGKSVKLLGGNMHHDNGPLGACACERAEVRRVQLMKKNGFNAIRTSHNPPSVAFLNACDPKPSFTQEILGEWFFADAYPSWTWEGYEGKKLTVDVYSREEEVALYLNGKEIGRQSNSIENKYILSFSINYTPGKLEAVAFNQGTAIDTFTLQTCEKAEKLVMTPDRKIIDADGRDLCFITIEINDRNNRRRPLDMSLVELELTGPGELIGFGSANPVSNESFQKNKRTTFEGRCLAIVKSTSQKGEIVIRVKSEGLDMAEVLIEVI